MALGIGNACSCVSPDVWIDATRSNDLTLQAKFTKHFRESMDPTTDTVCFDVSLR